MIVRSQNWYFYDWSGLTFYSVEETILTVLIIGDLIYILQFINFVEKCINNSQYYLNYVRSSYINKIRSSYLWLVKCEIKKCSIKTGVRGRHFASTLSRVQWRLSLLLFVLIYILLLRVPSRLFRIGTGLAGAWNYIGWQTSFHIQQGTPSWKNAIQSILEL